MKKNISHAIHANLSVNLKHRKSAVLIIWAPNAISQDSLQFINLPCSVSQSSDENETKSDRNSTGGFPCKTMGGRKKNLKIKYVSNVLQNNEIKTFESRLYCFNPLFLLYLSK